VKASVCLLLSLIGFSEATQAAELTCVGRKPGLYLASSGVVRMLSPHEKLTLDPSAKILVVGKNPSGMSETALSVMVTSTATEENANRVVQLSRNKIDAKTTACKQAFREDYIGDDNLRKSRDVELRVYDNHVNGKVRNNSDILKWGFFWKRSYGLKHECRNALNFLRPLEATDGRTTIGDIEPIFSASAARAASHSMEPNVGISSILLYEHVRVRGCFAFDLIRGEARGKSLTKSTIEVTDLSKPRQLLNSVVIEWK
jgi:hypothetical protein